MDWHIIYLLLIFMGFFGTTEVGFVGIMP
jgi:hypothetical protein